MRQGLQERVGEIGVHLRDKHGHFRKNLAKKQGVIPGRDWRKPIEGKGIQSQIFWIPFPSDLSVLGRG